MKTSTLSKYALLILTFLIFKIDSYASTCNWKARTPYFKVWDSCGATGKNKGNIYGYVGFNYSKNSCFKYQWSVNGINVSSGTTNPRMLQFQPGYNGKYIIRLKVTDTCNNCDTTFTDTATISCLTNKTNTCNWAARKVYFTHWDSCSSSAQSINAYIYFGYNKISCFKYSWLVNGKPTTSLNSNPRSFRFKPTANGVYTVCVKVTDTCDGCDTTICYNDTVKCFTAAVESMQAIGVGSWQIWPNPTRGVLHISGVSGDLVNYIVTDIKGSALLKGTISNGDDLLDISTLKEGIYFVELQNELGRKTVPVVYSK